MDGMGWGDIIFFGAIAAFIILRYRAMLGEQHGRDEDQIRRDQADRESEQERVIQLAQKGADEPKPAEVIWMCGKGKSSYNNLITCLELSLVNF